MFSNKVTQLSNILVHVEFTFFNTQTIIAKTKQLCKERPGKKSPSQNEKVLMATYSHPYERDFVFV